MKKQKIGKAFPKPRKATKRCATAKTKQTLKTRCLEIIKQKMTELQKQNYHDYILRNIFRRFEGRPYKELKEFLNYALELSEIASFTTAQGRELDPNYDFKNY
ncbi:hypothetical protein H9X57_16935 [Flavobacterium piscinae]|uniref:hypothetical protein n=1 Tax=Flavobacterium piscinae TaxID=2506424 RepID=UPI0019886994|nr:hypothetical protein [Flavobacterium piscinae]MBC8884449.1 hypothetical protein [Flavobacterium piscinae]